ncbi:MAG: LacI family DNA-binding transcriptional regulator [Anaerolineaceae bacterium]|nr:LacI family DNA-binding transcriptional regulator [Anaerolineaceae bacterium]
MTDKKRVTRKEVAERAGVSVAVVSYVVNNGPRPVAPETQAKVQQVIDELGYYPNELARSLSRQQTAIIGLIIPSLLNPVYAEIAESLERACIDEGYMVMVGGTGRDPDKEVEFAKLLRAKQVDGVVVLPSESPQAILEPLQQASIPVVVLEHDLPNTHCITMDELQGARLAMQHLLSLGHRRIGMIKRQPSSALSNLRFVGYCDNLVAAGIPCDPALVIESQAGQAAGYTSMRRLLALPNPPTAVFMHNDVLAMGAIRAIYDAGLTVPDDISVVGYDDTSNAAYLNPRLTTIKSPVAEVGRRAGQIIMELAQKQRHLPAQTITLPVELIVRASTAPPPEKS